MSNFAERFSRQSGHHEILDQLESDLAARDEELHRVRNQLRLAHDELEAAIDRLGPLADVHVARECALLFACAVVGPMLTPQQRAQVIQEFRQHLDQSMYRELAASIGGGS